MVGASKEVGYGSDIRREWGLGLGQRKGVRYGWGMDRGYG